MLDQHRTPRFRILTATSLAACVTICQGIGAGDLGVQTIVDRCGKALGVSSDSQALQTLSFVRRSGDPTRDEYWEIRRPNLVRRTRPERFVLVFDGQRAGFLEGPPEEDGTLRGPHLLPAEHWPHFEIDIALYFPAFFDTPAVYKGLATVEGTTAHLLEVNLPLGGRVLYWLDVESSLPIKVAVPDWELEMIFGDWTEVEGFKVPQTCWDPSKPNDIAHLEEWKVNVDLGMDRFATPER